MILIVGRPGLDAQDGLDRFAGRIAAAAAGSSSLAASAMMLMGSGSPSPLARPA
jgi:hypothetical protein